MDVNISQAMELISKLDAKFYLMSALFLLTGFVLYIYREYIRVMKQKYVKKSEELKASYDEESKEVELLVEPEEINKQKEKAKEIEKELNELNMNFEKKSNELLVKKFIIAFLVGIFSLLSLFYYTAMRAEVSRVNKIITKYEVLSYEYTQGDVDIVVTGNYKLKGTSLNLVLKVRNVGRRTIDYMKLIDKSTNKYCEVQYLSGNLERTVTFDENVDTNHVYDLEIRNVVSR